MSMIKSVDDAISATMTTGYVLDELHPNMSSDEISSLMEHSGYDPANMDLKTLDDIQCEINALEAWY